MKNENAALHIPRIVKQFKLTPRKNLGQNFLTDENILKRIIDIAEITPKDNVLEIGAGLGSLTRLLCKQASHVTTIEIDERFIPILQDILSPYNNCNIIHGNILKIYPEEIIRTEDYVVVANIPYYITSALIRHLLEAEKKPKRIILTIQYEVAKRLCASSNKMSLLALSVQIYGTPTLIQKIKPGAFYPRPKVDSAVIRIDLFENPLIEVELMDLFFDLARSGFGKKRKTLANSLSSGMGTNKNEIRSLLSNLGIDPRRRAETLSIAEWKTITQQWNSAFHHT
ncbi:MAG TPA: ribosomal RNA small subunit methyltransferase A [Anaerolineae bacterium]|nr:ribosomal RNA small subunit methyltransferase A [Anaerolineae bacterium]